MPTVSNQNIIVVLPEVGRIVRGQSNSIKIVLHQDYIGNPLNIGVANEVKVELYNSSNILVTTFSKTAGNLTYGAPNSDLQGEISIPLTGDQTAALPFTDAGNSGVLKAKVYVTMGVTLVQLPTIKLADIFDAGKLVGDIVTSRFTLPGSVYKVKSFVIGDKPAQGEVILSTSNPSAVTKIRIAVADDKGYRNSYLESVLQNRINIDGVKVSLFLTNVDNNSEYSTFQIQSWSRVDVLNADVNSPIDNDSTDAIELVVIPEGNSYIPGSSYSIEAGDELGVFTESYSSPHGISITPVGLATITDVNNITFSGGAIVNNNGNGNLDIIFPSVAVTTSGTSGSSGIDGTSGINGIDGTSGINGNDGTSGSSGINGNDGTSGSSGVDGVKGDAG